MSDSNKRDIELRIRAQDLSTADFQRVSAAVKELTVAVGQETEAAKKGAIGVQELRDRLKELEQAGKGLVSIQTAIDRFKQLSDALSANETKVDQARQKLETYRAELDKSNDSSKGAERQLAGYVKQLAAAEAVLESNRSNLAAQAALLQRAGVSTAELAAAERELKIAADQVGASLTALNETILTNARTKRELAAAAAELRAEELAAAEAVKAEAAAIAAAAKIEAEAIAATQVARRQEADQLRANLSSLMSANRERTASLEVFNAQTRALARQRQDDETRAARETARATVDEQNRRYAALNQSTEAFNAQTRALARQRNSQAAEDARAAVAQMRREFQQTNAAQAPTSATANSNQRGDAAAPGFLGLRPYELQNLSYQVNDIVSGLASGQNPTQILAQQGGQVLQIFNRNLLDLAKYTPLIVAGIAAVTVAVGALIRVVQEDTALRQFNAQLKLSADGAKYNADQLVATQREIRQLGVSWQDAGNTIRQAIEIGLPADKIAGFAQSVRDLADVTGKSIPDATKLMSEGFRGGLDGILQLNRQINFLTVEQAREISAMVDSGHATEAYGRAHDLLAAKLRDSAKGALSPFAQGLRELSTSWDNLETTLSHSDFIVGLTSKLSDLVNFIERTVKGIDHLADVAQRPQRTDQQAVNKALNDINSQYLGIPAWISKNVFGGSGAAGAEGLPDIRTDNNGPGSRFSNPRNLKLDTEDLKQLAELIAEASKTLPPGYRVEAISTERPGATVAGTGAPSEHSFGRALDVRIVDASGNPVPSLMTTNRPVYDPIFQKFDDTVKALAGNRSIAVGGRFGRSDAGHYSLDGPEASRQSGNGSASSAGGSTQTTPEVIAGNEILKQRKEALELEFNSNRQQERAVVLAQAQRDAAKDFVDDAQRRTAVDLKMREYDARAGQQDLDFQKEISKLRISDGKNAEIIFQAGEKARAKALADAKGGLISLAELNKAQLEGMAEQRAKFAQDDKLQTAERNLENQLAQLNRQNELKDTDSLANRLKGVADGYTAIRNNVKKLSEELSNTTVGPKVKTLLDSLLPKIDESEGTATQLGTLKFHTDKLNSLQTDRSTLIQSYNSLQSTGTLTAAEAEDKIREAYEKTTPAINAAYEAAMKFAGEADKIDATKLDQFKSKIEEVKAQATYISPLMKDIKDATANAFTSGLTNAFDTVGEALGGLIAKTKSWKDVLDSVKNAAASFFSGLLKAIANAIIRYEALKIASSLGLNGSGASGGLLGSLFGGGTAAAGVDPSVFAGSSTTGSLAADLLHTGGIAGRVSSSRSVPVSWFANAPRYHSGTASVGLAPDEQAAILKRGEEVLTRDNPRNIMNASRSSGSGVNIRSVLVMDEGSIPAAMAGAHGEKIVMSHITRNAATVRQLVGR